MCRTRCLLVLLLLATPAAAQDMPLSQVLIPGEGWHSVKRTFRSVGGLAADRNGNVYVADPEAKQVVRLDKDGQAHVFAGTGAGVRGLAFGPDGRLYGCQPEKRRIVVLTADGKESTFTEGVEAIDLTLTRAGDCYCSVPSEHAVYLVGRGGKKRRVAEGIRSPSGLVLWPDQGTLVVGDAEGVHLYAFRIEREGRLTDREAYYTLRGWAGRPSNVGGLTEDRSARLYAATALGVQIFDPTGRMSGVLLKPVRGRPVTAVTFGGPERDRLYMACGNQVYWRRTKARGVPVGSARD